MHEINSLVQRFLLRFSNHDCNIHNMIMVNDRMRPCLFLLLPVSAEVYRITAPSMSCICFGSSTVEKKRISTRADKELDSKDLNKHIFFFSLLKCKHRYGKSTTSKVYQQIYACIWVSISCHIL